MTYGRRRPRFWGQPARFGDFDKSLDDDAKADLLATIIEESERLNRFIANLLDMTGSNRARSSRTLRRTISGRSSGRLCNAPAKFSRGTGSPSASEPDLPMVNVDAVLFEQVLFNILDNAAKYAPPETTVTILGSSEHDIVRLQVLDEGEGIPDDSWSPSSTSSTGCINRIMCARARGWGSPSRADSSRQCTEPLRPRTAATDAGPCLRSACRNRSPPSVKMRFPHDYGARPDSCRRR